MLCLYSAQAPLPSACEEQRAAGAQARRASARASVRDHRRGGYTRVTGHNTNVCSEMVSKFTVRMGFLVAGPQTGGDSGCPKACPRCAQGRLGACRS